MHDEMPDRAGWGPIQSAVFDHWHGLRPAPGLLPSVRRFDPLALGPAAGRILPTLWLLDVEQATWRFRYRLIGEHVRRGSGQVRPGGQLNDFDPKGEALDLLIRVCRSCRPLHRSGPPLLRHHERVVAIETLLLPMATDGRHVDVLMNCTTYVWAADEAPTAFG